MIEELITQHQLQEDGSGRRRVRGRIHIKTAAGVSEWGTLILPYMSAIEDVSVQQLVVEKPTGRRVTPPSLALEDAVASGQIDTTILSDLRAKQIAVPALEPGDRLTYEVTTVRSASLIPGQFWIDHNFTRNAVVLRETLEIDAPVSRPLTIRVRRGIEAPAGTPAPAGRRVHRWTHAQATAPQVPTDPAALKALIEEHAKGSDVRVSSFKDWNQLGAWFGAVVDAKSEPDDTVRARARELTRGLDTPEQKLAALYTFVSTQIRYISLAFGVGRLEPRAASQVLVTQYGDCKDKHVLLASLARAIDLDIHPVLIAGGVDLDEQIPTPSQFDHMISVRTAAETPAWEWMDTTSGALPSGALLALHRDKRALLVPTGAPSRREPAAPRTASIVTTPANLRTPGTTAIDITGTIARDLLTARIVQRLTGDQEFLLRLAFRDATPQALAGVAKEDAVELGLKKVTIKGATFKDDGAGRPVEFAYDATHAWPLTYDKPWQLWLPTPAMALPKAPSDTDSGAGTGTPLELGPPMEATVTAKYEFPAVVRARPPVPVSVEREFATYTSTYRVDGSTLSVQRRLRTLVKEVPAAQMDSYRAFMRAVDADFRQQFAVDAIPRSTSSTPETANELNAAGYQAIQKRQIPQAIALLVKATTLDPQHKHAWNNLGLAYNHHREYDKAVEALRRQIAINPFDEYAYTNLGRALWGLKRTDEAIAQYKKQIEIAPLDKYAHAGLGQLYLELKRYDEAAASLERAASVTPNNASVWESLGKVRLERGEGESALTAFARAVELTPTPVMWNTAAWALAEKSVHLDVAERYARLAIENAARKLDNATLDPIKPEPYGAAALLPHFWDTLGWIYFQRGEFAKAESWLRAAWLLGQDAAIGEHLAIVYEKQGQRERAIEQYAQAVAAAGFGGPLESKADASRPALVRLIGASKIDARIATARHTLVAQRSLKLARLVTEPATANVSLLIAPDGRITQFHFIKGDERLRAPIATMTGLKMSATLPEGQTLTLLRQGLVGCSVSGGCTLVLFRPSDVPPPPEP